MALATILVFLVAFAGLGRSIVEAQNQTARLSDGELEALREIAITLGAKNVNLSNNPCQQQMLTFDYQSSEDAKNTLLCNCNFHNNTTCHVTAIVLKGLSLPGTLPTQMINLPYLETIDLFGNCLNGTLPKEWASMKLVTTISLSANNITGTIPKEWGELTALTYLSLEANQLTGAVPDELGNLVNLEILILSSNLLVGNLPMTFANLTKLQQFLLSDNSFNGALPDVFKNMTELRMLQMYASGLEGPVPTSIFHLENLTDLRISDMNCTLFDFPDLRSLKSIKYLTLRNLNISGALPTYMFQMPNLEMLDVSFNELSERIPNVTAIPGYIFLSGNMLSGGIPDAFINTASSLDLSYNNLTWSPTCQATENINQYHSSGTDSLSGLLPCSHLISCAKLYQSLNINCGGQDVNIKNNLGTLHYEGDGDAPGGASLLYMKKNSNWGFSSSGVFLADAKMFNKYTAQANSTLSGSASDLYLTARLAPISLTYFGYCLLNDVYKVKLHFAEIQFNDKEAFNSLGTRIFDVYIQGELVLKNFNIMEEANGIGRPVIKNFNASVMENTLEIRLSWTGKGTTVIPRRGVYGPLISAITVCPSSRSHCEDSKISKAKTIEIVVGICISLACLLLVGLAVLSWRLHLANNEVGKDVPQHCKIDGEGITAGETVKAPSQSSGEVITHGRANAEEVKAPSHSSGDVKAPSHSSGDVITDGRANAEEVKPPSQSSGEVITDGETSAEEVKASSQSSGEVITDGRANAEEVKAHPQSSSDNGRPFCLMSPSSQARYPVNPSSTDQSSLDDNRPFSLMSPSSQADDGRSFSLMSPASQACDRVNNSSITVAWKNL